MKILLITGNHPRHFYFIKKFQKTSFDLSLIIEKRKDKFMPLIKKATNQILKNYINYISIKETLQKKNFSGIRSLIKRISIFYLTFIEEILKMAN